ncbi:hypothetical protein CEXT_481441 [Caerostris extrusa]|uniref:Uncharacterized protein n=1 Tax=Caerostris extrusa TaxID=172846 RepID=A0AAV4W9V1_CAEEX|nr:hypothetical protein CEXT_481441 [Caerostris extrusa]
MLVLYFTRESLTFPGISPDFPEMPYLARISCCESIALHCSYRCFRINCSSVSHTMNSIQFARRVICFRLNARMLVLYFTRESLTFPGISPDFPEMPYLARIACCASIVLTDVSGLIVRWFFIP